MFRFNINPDSDIPIYRQLVDQINASIRSGAIPTGTQLPTVREMAEQLHLSCGTVKRVYDRLQEMGDIEMARRRGTVVKYVREDRDSRKVKAMTAIDRMIRQLSDLNFSPAEIQIFLNLKMREWGLKWSGIRIALVTDYGELAPSLEKQLASIGNVRVSAWQLRQLREYPYGVDEQSDVILSSAKDAQMLQSVLPDSSKLVRLAFELNPDTIFALAACNGKMGVLCKHNAFADLVRSCLPQDRQSLLYACPVDESEDPSAQLGQMEKIILAPNWEMVYPANLCRELERFRNEGRCIVFDYRIDEGSMIYLEERINRIRVERQLQPGTLQF